MEPKWNTVVVHMPSLGIQSLMNYMTPLEYLANGIKHGQKNSLTDAFVSKQTLQSTILLSIFKLFRDTMPDNPRATSILKNGLYSGGRIKFSSSLRYKKLIYNFSKNTTNSSPFRVWILCS